MTKCFAIVLVLASTARPCAGQSIAWADSSDIITPMPNGFMYNSTLYYRTATGGWIWDTGYIQPMTNGGAVGWGLDTLPGGMALTPQPRPYRPGVHDLNPTPLDIPLGGGARSLYPTWYRP